MSNVLFRIELDKAELSKQTMTVTDVVVMTMKFLFGMCNCMVDSNVGKGHFSLVLGLLCVCVDTHVIACIYP